MKTISKPQITLLSKEHSNTCRYSSLWRICIISSGGHHPQSLSNLDNPTHQRGENIKTVNFRNRAKLLNFYNSSTDTNTIKDNSPTQINADSPASSDHAPIYNANTLQVLEVDKFSLACQWGSK